MRHLRLALALFLAALATPAAAIEFSSSKQSYELTVMFGQPPPEGATPLPGEVGVFLYQAGGRLYLTGQSGKSLTPWATFDLGAFEAWRVIGPGKKPKTWLVEVVQDGRRRKLNIDASKLDMQAKLKFTLE